MLIGFTVACTDAQQPIANTEITSLERSSTATLVWPGAVVGPDYTRPPTQTPFPEATVLPTTLPPPAPRLNGERVGMQLVLHRSDKDWAEAMLLVERLGIRWIKLPLAWDYLQASGPTEWEENFKAHRVTPARC